MEFKWVFILAIFSIQVTNICYSQSVEKDNFNRETSAYRAQDLINEGKFEDAITEYQKLLIHHTDTTPDNLIWRWAAKGGIAGIYIMKASKENESNSALWCDKAIAIHQEIIQEIDTTKNLFKKDDVSIVENLCGSYKVIENAYLLKKDKIKALDARKSLQETLIVKDKEILQNPDGYSPDYKKYISNQIKYNSDAIKRINERMKSEGQLGTK